MNYTVKKRILVLTSTFPRWQDDTDPPFVFELCKRLLSKYEITVLAPHCFNAALHEHIDGVEVYRFRYCLSHLQNLAYQGGILANLKKNPLNYLLIPLFAIAQFRSLLRLLSTSKFHIIHAHWLLPQGLLACMARNSAKTQPTVVCTAHGGDLFGLSGRFMTWLKAKTISQLDKLAVVSEAMRTYAANIQPNSDIAVISMGVDLKDRFRRLPTVNRDSCTLLFVGRLVEKKGVSYLIRAMPEIIRQYPEAKLLIVGDGPEKLQLQELAKELKIQLSIEFLGAINNSKLDILYNRASIFVAPSIVTRNGDQEGLGLVLVEALGCECPVITTNLPAIRDVIKDGVTGLICAQKSSEDIAIKICNLLQDEELHRALSKQGREYVLKNFDWDIVTDNYSALFEAAMVRHENIQ